MSVAAGEEEERRRDEGEDESKTDIMEIYLGAARELVRNILDPVDKEICSLWLDFIFVHIGQVSSVFDYLKLFLLALHQPIRVPPFDNVPPSVEEIEDEPIDVIAMGRKMMEDYRTYQKEQSIIRPESLPCDKNRESLPAVELSSSANSKDYFATQQIPSFGRQCYYGTSTSQLPFWWPVNSEQGQPKDYLSRLALFMFWQESKRKSKFDECTHIRKSVTTRTWLKDAIELTKKQEKYNALGFCWHDTSSLPYSRTKLDKKEIQKFFQNAETKGLEVFAIDESVESMKNKPLPEEERLTFTGNIKDILSKKPHGTVDPTKTMANVLDEHIKEKEYNTDWFTSMRTDNEPTGEGTEKFLRKMEENKLKRLLLKSPETVNVEEESLISRLTELYDRSRCGDEPPPPSPDETSVQDLLHSGVSWRIPAFKQTYAGHEESSPCQPCEEYPQERVREQRFSNRGIQEQEECSPFDDNQGYGFDPRQSFNRSRGVHDRSGGFQMGQSSFGAGSPGKTSPSGRPFGEDSFGAGSGGKRGSFQKKLDSRSPKMKNTQELQGRKDSLGFGDVEELDFLDQFIMPTADISFNEQEQEECAPFEGGYDEVDDGWVAPPEVEPEEPYEIGLPPVGYGRESEECNRREGRVFMLPDRREYKEEELEPIFWPETEHLYDMDINFQKEDPPFDFLDVDQSRNEFTPCDEQEELQRDQQWRDLSHVADQLGFQNF